MVAIGNDWDELLRDEFSKPYYVELKRKLAKEYRVHTIYPDMYDVFNALKYTSYKDVKVVILGQDPYHGPGQAHGLSFSVKDGIGKPPSLTNIFKEIHSDIGCPIPASGCLEGWANQGVLLFNATLTVREGVANSHQGIGWSYFTDRIIELLNKRENPIIFLLWGNNARKKASIVTNKHHKLLETVHPSPLSAHNGFFGCKHFSKTNKLLTDLNMKPIDWGMEGWSL